MIEPVSARSPEFLSAARAAVATSGETLIIFRWAFMAGAKDWYLAHSPEELNIILAKASANTSISIFLQPELPLRGRVDENLKSRARALLADLKEILVADWPPNGFELCFDVFDQEIELDEWLSQRVGKEVAVGRYPPFWLDNGPVQLTAYVPDYDGVIRPGAY